MRRVVLGLDQGRDTGWGIAGEGLGKIFRHGLTSGALTVKAAAARAEVVKLALAYAGGDARFLFAMFEQHDHMPIDRLTRHDHQTQRRGRQGAPERSTKSVIGQGKSAGRWEEQLLLLGVSPAHMLEVIPPTWRKATHGHTRGEGDALKLKALEWANLYLGAGITDHNEAEGVCITAFAAFHGLAAFDADKQAVRMDARIKREGERQAELFGGGK